MVCTMTVYGYAVVSVLEMRHIGAAMQSKYNFGESFCAASRKHEWQGCIASPLCTPNARPLAAATVHRRVSPLHCQHTTIPA